MLGKKGVLILASILLISLTVSFVSAVTCDVRLRTACTGAGEVVVMGLSSTTNAHGEDSSSSVYSNVLCCDGSGIADSSCALDESIVALSSSTNAHGESPDVGIFDYTVPICYDQLGVCMAFGGATDCTSDPLYSVETISISSMKNAHVGNFADYNLKICCEDVSGGLPPPGNAFWADVHNGMITEKEIVVNDNEIYMTFKDVGIPGAIVTFEIRDEDTGLDDEIRTGADAITGIVGSDGSLTLNWTINDADIEKAKNCIIVCDSDWKFYFEVYDNLGVRLDGSGPLDITIKTDNNNDCIQYTTPDDCKDYTKTAAVSTMGIENCGMKQDLDSCSVNIKCFCAWDSGTCNGGSIEGESDCPLGWECPERGSWEILQTNNNNNCDDGFLSYSWDANWTWAIGNNWTIYPDLPIGSNPNIIDDGGTWRCQALTTQEDGSKTIQCPAQIKLPFFSFMNLIAVAIAISVIYYFISLKKKPSKSKKGKKRKKK